MGHVYSVTYAPGPSERRWLRAANAIVVDGMPIARLQSMSVGSPPPAKPGRKGDWAVHVALGAAIIIAGAWLFGGVAPEWLTAKAIAGLDLQSAKWLHEHAGPTLTAFMVWVSALHGTAGILVLAAGAGAILWHRRDW